MPRGLVVLFALLEALFVVGLGIFLPFIFGVVGWASLTGVNSTPVAIWQLAVQAWALGHGVPLEVSLGDTSAVLVNEMATFTLTLAPFAFALLTALLGRRAGRRLAGSDDATLVVGLLVFFTGTLALLALLSGQSSLVQLDVASGSVRVLAPFVVGLVIGWRPWDDNRSSRALMPDIPSAWRAVIDTALRIAGATLAGLVVIASFALLALLFVGFSTEIALYESLHTGILGGLVITVAQLAFIPVALVWTISWIAGPGFTLGTGAIVSPFVTTVGALPAIPVLGAVPETNTLGEWVTVLPAIFAFIAATRFSADLRSRGQFFNPGNIADLGRVVIAAALAAVAIALTALLVGSYATGSAGPGRFAQVGIDPIAVGLVLAGGVFAGSLAGLLLGKLVRDSKAMRGA
ncbi:MAG: hypothetical protein RL294_382 [Actinomycetota bacterium]